MVKSDWSEHDHLLGTMPDRKLAELRGCNINQVFNRRKELSIVCFSQRHWTSHDDALFESGTNRCTSCGFVKPVDAFHKSPKCTRTGRTRQCIECINAKSRRMRAELKAYAVGLLGGHCQACGFDQFLTSLQFHHVLDNKIIEIGQLLWRPRQKAALRNELDKCCLLCSNCHDAFQWKELPLKFVKESLGYTVDKIHTVVKKG